MKKIILSILTLFISIMPFISVKAVDKDPVNVYLFRGEGCPHCEEFLEFIDNLDEDIKEMINVVDYEVWYDTNNKALMQKVAKTLGDEASGVPYIIIGRRSFTQGYSSSMDDEIITTIKDYYYSDERYDVMNNLTEEQEEKVNPLAIGIVLAIVIVGGIGLVIVSSKHN